MDGVERRREREKKVGKSLAANHIGRRQAESLSVLAAASFEPHPCVLEFTTPFTFAST